MEHLIQLQDGWEDVHPVKYDVADELSTSSPRQEHWGTQTHRGNWVFLPPLKLWLPKASLLSLWELTSPFWSLLPAPPLHSTLALLASQLFQNIPRVPTPQPFPLAAASGLLFP